MLYRRGKVWWVKIGWEGQTIRRSTETTNKELAKRVEAKVITELSEGKWFEKEAGRAILFRDVWDKYLKEDAKYKAKGTFARATQCANRFLPHFGELTLSQVTPARLSTYKARRLEDGVKIGTVVKELQFMRRAFSLCKRDWQLIRQSPFEFFRMPPVRDQRVRYLEDGQFAKLLAKCPPWLQPIVTLARYTGMRRGNVLDLTWDQVDFSKRLIRLEHTKNGERLVIPLAETAYVTLATLKRSKVAHLNCPYVFHERGQPLSPGKVGIAFRRSCKQAGIEDFRFHDLRHDFASSLVQNGNELYVVQHLLGHKDSRMTQRYAHLRIENLRDAVETLEWGHKKGHSGPTPKGRLSVTA